MTNAQVSGSTHPFILMPLMFQIPNLVGIGLSISQGKVRATVRRAIVNQQQFPIFVGLGKDA